MCNKLCIIKPVQNRVKQKIPKKKTNRKKGKQETVKGPREAKTLSREKKKKKRRAESESEVRREVHEE